MQNPFVNIEKEHMQRVMEFSRQQLLENVERAVLPEHLFRQHFLPFFLGNTNPDPKNEVVAAWIGIAGAPTAEVDIIDDARNVLFTTPAIFSTASLNTDINTHRSQRLRDLCLDVAHQELSLAPLAAATLARGLQQKADDIVQPSQTSQDEMTKWRKIYEFYKLPLPNQQKQTASQAQALDDDEILGYQ